MTTYLYVKTHNVSGLKYFGKTTKDDYISYPGSGKYWRRHLSKYGYDFSTILIAKFEEDEIDVLVEFATKFSIENEIVSSNEWANLQIENGLDGAPVGHVGHRFTQDEIDRISKSSKERWNDQQYRYRLSQSHKSSWTNERRISNSEMMKKRWDENRRYSHGEQIREHHRNDPDKYSSFYEMVRSPRTDKHRNSISESLRGLAKSDDHRKSLSWSRYLKTHPDTTFGSYDEMYRFILETYDPNTISAHRFSKQNNVPYGIVLKIEQEKKAK